METGDGNIHAFVVASLDKLVTVLPCGKKGRKGSCIFCVLSIIYIVYKKRKSTKYTRYLRLRAAEQLR